MTRIVNEGSGARTRRMPLVRYLLDTTVLIDHVRGKPSAVELVLSLFSEPNDLYVCDAVVTESLSKGPDEEVALIDPDANHIEAVCTR